MFHRVKGSWKKIGKDYGATHHVRPLSKGGTDDPENIVVLCSTAHGIAHSRACRGIRDRGELIAAIRREMGLG